MTRKVLKLPQTYWT